ncbi:MAG: flagellar export chaperone FliS [Alphaproteobacteria bacterium]|nr:flagellar export chaperone FliS [Alphaproteobacteria bacterium]
MNADISKYLTQEVMTASPAKLVSMLYDKAVMSLKEAIVAIEANDIEARWKANARAIEIISHMWSTLDIEKGGEIASNLNDLFSFMLARLPEIDIHNDPEPAREVIVLLEPLQQPWRELARQQAGGQNSSADTAPGSAEITRLPTSLSA